MIRSSIGLACLYVELPSNHWGRQWRTIFLLVCSESLFKVFGILAWFTIINDPTWSSSWIIINDPFKAGNLTHALLIIIFHHYYFFQDGLLTLKIFQLIDFNLIIDKKRIKLLRAFSLCMVEYALDYLLTNRLTNFNELHQEAWFKLEMTLPGFINSTVFHSEKELDVHLNFKKN